MTSSTDVSEPLIVVDAPCDEIDSLLRQQLSAEDFALIQIELISNTQETHNSRRRGVDPDSFIAAIQFVGLAVVSGYTHDLVKTVLRILIRRWGKDRVFTGPQAGTDTGKG